MSEITSRIGRTALQVLFVVFLGIIRIGNVAATGDSIPDLVQFCADQKGFNLLGKFDVSWSNTGFTEKEFQLVHNMGFNFVRLPLDFRTYTQAGKWYNFLETEMVKIDRAVAWGQKYGVHVCINLHRAPGYCVNSATLPVSQQLNLWTDTAAQRAFVTHWTCFAERYKDVPPAKLSFNLVNEPSNVAEAPYLVVMKKAIAAIHAISPERVIFVDGLDYGRVLLPALKDEAHVAQAIHCYDPFGITHYKAEWVEGSDSWPVPRWPMLWVSNYLYGPWKSSFKSPLIFEGSFSQGTEITVNVRQVSIESTLLIKADGKSIYTKRFVCSADTGADFSQVDSTQWGFQNISNKDFTTTLGTAASKISFENSAGDWMTINFITIKKDQNTWTYNLSDDSWGKKQATYQLGADGVLRNPDGTDLLPFATYRSNVAIAKENNIPMMVQEFGVHNQTPHDVTIAFLNDLIKFFHENRIGYALWNLKGSFGILNSDRKDCTYELYEGYKLDAEMLEVLTQFSTIVSSENLKCMRVFPVPANEKLLVSAGDFAGDTQFEIHDLSGRIVRSSRQNIAAGGICELDIAGLKSSMYLLSAVSQGNRYSARFVKQ